MWPRQLLGESIKTLFFKEEIQSHCSRPSRGISSIIPGRLELPAQKPSPAGAPRRTRLPLQAAWLSPFRPSPFCTQLELTMMVHFPDMCWRPPHQPRRASSVVGIARAQPQRWSREHRRAKSAPLAPKHCWTQVRSRIMAGGSDIMDPWTSCGFFVFASQCNSLQGNDTV